MKIGIVGTGSVGCASAMAAVLRGSAREIVLVNRTRKTAEAVVYPQQLVHNVVPGGWKPDQEGYNEEEVKIMQETRKILHQPDLPLAATCVRVPVPVGHGEAVFLNRVPDGRGVPSQPLGDLLECESVGQEQLQ